MAFAVRGAAKVVWDAVGGCCRYNFGVKSCKSRTVKTAPAAKGMLQISATPRSGGYCAAFTGPNHMTGSAEANNLRTTISIGSRQQTSRGEREKGV